MSDSSATHSPAPMLAVNAMWSTVGSVAVSAALFFIDVAFIRLYGPDAHGEVFWALSVVSMAMLLCDLGLTGPAAVRRIARERDAGDRRTLEREVSWIATTALLMAAIVAVAVFLVAGESAIPGRATWLRGLSVWVVLLTAMRVCRMVCFGFERIRGAIVVYFLADAGRLAILLALGFAGAQVKWVLAGWTAALVAVSALGLWIMVRVGRGGGLRLRPSLPSPTWAGAAVARSLPYFTPTLWVAGLPFLMLLIVGHWHRGETVSVFKVCLSLAFLARMLITPLTSILLPRLSWALARGGGDMKRAVESVAPVARLQGMVVTLAFAAILAIGAPMLDLIYGPLYAKQGVTVLLILIVAIGIDDFAQILNQLLLAGKHVGAVNLWEGLKLVVLGGVVFLWVPQGGAQGAAWALLVGVGVNAAGKLLTARHYSSGVGAMAFARMLGVLGGLLALAQLPLGHVAWRVAVLGGGWGALALATRLLRPAEVLDWSRTLGRVVFQRRP